MGDALRRGEAMFDETGGNSFLALTSLKECELERRHRASYERHPLKPGEFDG